MKKSRNWNRIKGYRDPSPQIPVVARIINECLVVHNRCKFCFWTELPLEKELKWADVHGMRVDDRLWPTPPNFETLRPLRKPDRQTPQQAKKVAFAVLREDRARALVARVHPNLFGELPVQFKPHRK